MFGTKPISSWLHHFMMAALVASIFANTGCRVPVVDRANGFENGVPMLGSDICCPAESHPAGSIRSGFGKVDRRRYGPQRLSGVNPYTLVASWHEGADCDGRWTVLERFVGKRRVQHCLPFSKKHNAGICRSDLYGPPRDCNYDESVRSNAFIYFTLDKKETIDGLQFSNHDIVAFDGTGFARLIDGDDIGLNNLTIDAFAVVDESRVIMSFAEDFEVDADHALPGLTGKVDASDLVMFVPNQLGEITRGTFEFFFDGSDVGLSGEDENIDALEVLASGELVISTKGPVNVKGVKGEDRDLLMFIPGQLGRDTDGKWKKYLRVNKLDLSKEKSNQINGLSLDDQSRVYMSFEGAFQTDDVEGAASDVGVFRPSRLGKKTKGKWQSTPWLKGKAIGFGKNDIIAMDLVAPTCGLHASVLNTVEIPFKDSRFGIPAPPPDWSGGTTNASFDASSDTTWQSTESTKHQ